MKIQPLADTVIIEPEEVERKTATGIILPEGQKDTPEIGKVISVGPGRIEKSEKGMADLTIFIRFPMDVKKGDRVVYKKWAGNTVKIEGKEYVLVSLENILAIL